MSALTRALLDDAARTVVLIGGADLDEVIAAVSEHDVAARRFATLSDCLAAGPETLATSAVLSLPSTLAARAGREALIGAACRAFPARLLLLVPGSLAVPVSELFAFGFRQLHETSASSLFEYRLSDYKQPPDWLNARFWANPERFAVDPDNDDSEFDETGMDDEE